MPAEECLCIKEALKQGTIDLDTHILAIDRDYKVCNKIREELTKLGFNHLDVYNGKLENSGSWLEYKGKGKIDYAFFDCCGECREDILDALILNNTLFKKGAYIAFTFQAFTRHSHTKEFLRCVKNDMEDHYKEIPNCFHVLKPCANDAQTKGMNAILWYLHGWPEYKNAKLTFFQGYRRNPTGKCVSMFSAQFLLK